MNNNILNYMQFAQSNADSGNNYNNKAYNAQQNTPIFNTINPLSNLISNL